MNEIRVIVMLNLEKHYAVSIVSPFHSFFTEIKNTTSYNISTIYQDSLSEMIHLFFVRWWIKTLILF